MPSPVKLCTLVSPRTPLPRQEGGVQDQDEGDQREQEEAEECRGLRLFTNIKWPAPTKVSQGTKEAFSTGSHAQNPPKLNASYAHAPPIRMPVPRIMIPK
jgi:hypothetical protein